MKRLFTLALPVLLLCSVLFAVEKSTIIPNSDQRYLALRNPSLSGEAYAVKGLKLEREGAIFTFSGTFWTFAPVNGKVTGAVFSGEGSISIEPPTPIEGHQLAILTKEPRFNETFDEMYLRFTDGTYEQIKVAGTKSEGSGGQGIVDNGKKKFRDDLQYNIAGRLLQDVNSSTESGFFNAVFKGHKYSGKLMFEVDPHGVPAIEGLPLAPEEVTLTSFDDNKYGIWCAYHRPAEYRNGTAVGNEPNGLYNITDQKIDLSIEKNGRLDGKATTTVVAMASELTVVPFALYPTLRVSAVTDGSGKALNFIQEDKDRDSQYFVILDQRLKKGEKIDVVTFYAGKDAVSNEGGSNFYMSGGARDSWYPNLEMGHFENYDLILRVPKGLSVVATGNPVGDKVEGNQLVSEWKTEHPEVNAGFQIGKFKKLDAKLEKANYVVEAYANSDTPEILEALKRANDGEISLNSPRVTGVALGTMSTVDMGKKALAEGQLAIDLYTWLYGPSRFKRIALTQQTAGNYGQSWPGMVYLPITYFLDDTVKHQLGIDDYVYFRFLASHEIGHQWWGDTVSWSSYRDQWMSEGFAHQASSMYAQMALKRNEDFMKFWHDEREALVRKNRAGNRPIDVGPVTMGGRLNTFKAGSVYQAVIYSKGAYIAHMIRMMMWSPSKGDEPFRQMMTDFAQTYAGKNATTEDFKATVEKHMTASMDLDGNHRLDWFFNEYVYGTAMPTYNFQGSFSPGPNGTTTLSFKLAQTGVDDNFKMNVPVYVEMPGKKIVRIGQIPITGNSTVENKVNLPLKEAPSRALINAYYDVLGNY